MVETKGGWEGTEGHDRPVSSVGIALGDKGCNMRGKGARVYVDKVITNLWQDLGKGTQQDKRHVKIAERVRDKMDRGREKGGRWNGKLRKRWEGG